VKIIRRFFYWIAAFVLLFLTFWFGFVRQPPKKVVEEKIVPVEVETVTTGSIEETVELTGWIKASTVVDITSKVPGRIESLRAVLDGGSSVPLEEGLVVKKGQQLAVIDHDVYLAQVAAAKADLQAREVEMADAEREKKRISSLYESGSATEQSKDKAVTAAALAAARVSLAKANLRLAEINLKESTVVAPIDGIVTVKHIDQGNLINAGERIVTVADIKTVKVIVVVAERYGAKVYVGMPARIKVDAYGDRIFDANVYSIYPALDEQTHMVQVEIRLDNDDLLLKPGMFARVALILRRNDDVIVIPRDVVLGGKIDEPYVYVVEDEVARKRFVEIGIRQADRYEIVKGLKQGDKLVINGVNYLTDGIKVKVVKLEEVGVSRD